MIVRTDPRSVAARWAANSAQDMTYFKSTAAIFHDQEALEAQAGLIGEAIGLADRLQTTLAVIAAELTTNDLEKEPEDESDC